MGLSRELHFYLNLCPEDERLKATFNMLRTNSTLGDARLRRLSQLAEVNFRVRQNIAHTINKLEKLWELHRAEDYDETASIVDELINDQTCLTNHRLILGKFRTVMNMISNPPN